MPLIERGGGPALNVVRSGPRGASPVVFLHAVGLDLTWWGDQFAAFTDEYDVVAFDMPQHGRSAPASEPPSFPALATALEDVLDAVGAGPAHLVGVSVGGMIAQTFALRRPDLVRSLSLVATLCTFPDEVRRALRERARVARTEGMERIAELSTRRWFPPAFRARRPDVLDRATTCLLRQDAGFHADMWEMVATLDLAAQLPRITCPTMVVAGGEDGNAPVAAAETLTRLIPGASLEVLPGVGHFPPLEVPDAFNRLLHRFLTTVDAASAKDARG